jgi:predicted Rossmann-fold nucleotide-binding protein
MMNAMEIETLDELDDHLESGAPLRGLRLQRLDLTAYADRLAALPDLTGLVVLGGTVPPDVSDVLVRRGAIVFPGLGDAPIDPWRGLYFPEDLYEGLERGYSETPDARAYEWSIRARVETDAYCTLVTAIHDDSVTDHLDEVIEGRSVVGVMGGHATDRGSEAYAAAARLGHELAELGHLVATGGGPGAMEAANLGAFCRDTDSLAGALDRLGAVPGFEPDITAWATVAMDVRREILDGEPRLPADVLGLTARSVGIPTWFYGHEPPNVFCDVVAKYFSNALREDGLLARSVGGVVILPGAAGTVQEIFQAVTPLYYAREDAPLAPLVLVGREHWTERLPVWPLLQHLAQGRRMGTALHLVDRLEDALSIV